MVLLAKIWEGLCQLAPGGLWGICDLQPGGIGKISAELLGTEIRGPVVCNQWELERSLLNASELFIAKLTGRMNAILSDSGQAEGSCGYLLSAKQTERFDFVHSISPKTQPLGRSLFNNEYLTRSFEYYFKYEQRKRFAHKIPSKRWTHYDFRKFIKEEPCGRYLFHIMFRFY